MQAILRKINRIGELNLEEGKPFTILLTTDKPKEDKMVVGGTYKIKVKKYMTEPATTTFDFQDKWNEGQPMPLLVMTGEVLQETRGMYKMTLHAVAESTSHCMKCGRTLTHPVSRLYGIGPECGQHFHINPYDTEEELQANLQELKNTLAEIVWTGWVIKSAITEWEEVNVN